MISVTTIDRLMQLGQRRGRLEIDDVRQALPVDTMTTTELADVLARLEEDGISVEIDASLLTSHHGKMSSPVSKPAIVPSRRAATDDDRLSILASSIKAARTSSNAPGGPVRPYSKKSGTIFVVAAALLLILLTLIIWRFV